MVFFRKENEASQRHSDSSSSGKIRLNPSGLAG
jgi:hypothetical protein